jgi:aryl-alcohol dehydrogenase-like predicted oxidoreductase
MDNRRLGTTDIELSPIGLGALQFAGRGMTERLYRAAIDQPTVDAVVRTALDGGITWFDTAEMYGRGQSERALSTALRDNGIRSGDVRIATKWAPMLRTARSIGRTIGDRRRALGEYPIDLHQIHEPYTSLSPIPGQLREMAKLLRDGQITSVGVSNFSAKQLAKAYETLRAQGISLASNQVQINLLNRDIETNGVLDTARRLGVTLIAYSPLASGLLTGKYHENPELVGSLSRIRRLFGQYDKKSLARTAPLIEELRAIAGSYGVTPGQVALNWLITFYGDTVLAIPGASKPRHAEESAGAMAFTLTEKELDRLDELSRNCAK